MKKLIKRIFRGKYYKNGESYVGTIIICIVVGALLMTACSPAAKSGLESAEKSGLESAEKSGLESAKNKVNDLFGYNPDGEDGPGGGDTSIPGGGDKSEPEEPMKPYLTFQSANPFTISVASPKWNGTMEYSTDTENWTAWDGSEISSVEGKLYLRGRNNTMVSVTDLVNYSQFVISGTAVECVGNIETLLDWQTVVDGQHPVMDNYCFAYAFRNCSALITAPSLPSTTLAEGCYYRMFSNCTSLITAPALPATTLAYYCYEHMFDGCTNLKVSETQTSEYKYEWRIPTEGTISSTPSGWNTDMFANTGGTFTGDPVINTTYYLEYPPVG